MVASRFLLDCIYLSMSDAKFIGNLEKYWCLNLEVRMEIEKIINQLITKIINNINSTIPTLWTEVVLYSEIYDDGGACYYFFKEENSLEYIYNLFIPSKYEVSLVAFRERERKTFELLEKLNGAFKDNGLVPWTTFILVYKNGKLETKFGYIPWLNSEYNSTDRMNYFRYKYTDYVPKDDNEKKKFHNMEKFQQFN